MGWLDLTLALGQRTGATLDEEAIERIDTVRDLPDEVASASRGDGAAPLEEPEQVLDERQKRWLEPRSERERRTALALASSNRALMRNLFRLEAHGAEHVPHEGPSVLVANHVSHLDPFAIAAALDNDQLLDLHWGGWTGVTLRNPITRTVTRLARAVPVDPKRGAMSSLAFGAAVLQRGRALGWFPEGERSETGELQPFKPGIGRLLEKHRVPVVPVAIRGSEQALPRGRLMPTLRPIQVVVGEPVTVDELERTGEGDTPADRITEALHARIEQLLAQPVER